MVCRRSQYNTWLMQENVKYFTGSCLTRWRSSLFLLRKRLMYIKGGISHQHFIYLFFLIKTCWHILKQVFQLAIFLWCRTAHLGDRKLVCFDGLDVYFALLSIMCPQNSRKGRCNGDHVMDFADRCHLFILSRVTQVTNAYSSLLSTFFFLLASLSEVSWHFGWISRDCDVTMAANQLVPLCHVTRWPNDVLIRRCNQMWRGMQDKHLLWKISWTSPDTPAAAPADWSNVPNVAAILEQWDSVTRSSAVHYDYGGMKCCYLLS